MKARRRSASLVSNISLVVFFVVAVSTISIGLSGYLLYRTDSIDAHGSRALAIAETIASAMDPEEYKAILQSGKPNAYWDNFKQFVDDIKVRNSIVYLYILDSKYDDQVVYFMEGNAPQDTDHLTLLDREPVDDHADEVFFTLADGVSRTTDIYPTESFGSMLSGLAPIKDATGHVLGIVGVDISVEDVLASSRSFGTRMLLIAVVSSSLFCLAAMWFVKRRIGQPIAQLTRAADRMALGDNNVEIRVETDDEIGRLARSFLTMAESTRSQIAILERLADGDLSASITARSELDSMSGVIAKLSASLSQLFVSIRDSARQVSAGAQRMAASAQDLAGGAQTQSSAVEQLLGSISEVSQKTNENAQLSDRASQLAGSIRNKAERGSEQMDRMIQAVKEINDASRAIGNVIKVIDDIAFQTNILALNAAVEAAHAGQNGKGFAVVAEEVRSLAAKSAQAASQTSQLIENSIQKAGAGASMAAETASSLADIVEGIEQSSRIIGDISTFSKEQDAALKSISSGVQQVAHVAASNTGTSEQNATASHEMSMQAEHLQDLIGQFTLNDRQALPRGDRFLLEER